MIPLTYKRVFLCPVVEVRLTYDFLPPSIAYGVIAGILSYMILNGVPRLLRIISKGRIVPPNYEDSEAFVIPPGGIVPLWIRKLLGRSATEEDMVGATTADDKERDIISEPSSSSHEKP
jgi:AGZA family xanthine/uracil permease-like MFS transporter